MRQTTIDLQDEIEAIRGEKLPAVEEGIVELIEEFEEEYESYSSVPAAEERAYEKLEEKRIELKGRAEALERVVDEWNGSEFVVEELTTGNLASIQDSVAEASFDFDPQEGEMTGGVPRQGYGMVETLRHSIVRAPPGAPSTIDPATGNENPEPADYPQQVGMFLFERINSFNTVGDTDLGNSSLRERMNS